MSKQFVCVVEECFFLYPPAWLKDPPDPVSTALFKQFVSNAPDLWPENTSTHQGLYIMTADGDFLGGDFASQSNSNARQILAEGWEAWTQANKNPSAEVPRNTLPLFGGDPLQRGGLKLRAAYRDLPRGDDQRPGDSQFENPYNIGWLDFTAEEAAAFLPPPGEDATPVEVTVLQKLALSKLKDSVRGQIDEWNQEDWREGELIVELEQRNGDVSTYRLSGSAVMQRRGSDLGYSARLTGYFSFDSSRREFTGFQMLAVGQRTGAGPFNGREGDPGPAPMAVAFRLFH